MQKNADGSERSEAELAADKAWDTDDGHPIDDYWWYGFVAGYEAHQKRVAADHSEKSD